MPAEITLAAESGRATGTRPSKRLRGDGKVPAVVYGQGSDPVAVAVDRRELRHALSGPAGLNTVINLEVGGRHQADRRQVAPAPPGAPQRHPRRLPRREPQRGDHDGRPGLARGRGQGGPVRGRPARAPPHPAGRDHHAAQHPQRAGPRRQRAHLGDAIRVGDIALPAGVTTERRPRHHRRHRRRVTRAAVPRKRRPRARARAARPATAARAKPPRAALASNRPWPCSAGATGRSGGARRATSWSSASATRARSTRARATTSARRWSSELARRHGSALKRSKERALVAEVTIGGQRVALAFPHDLHEPLGRVGGHARAALRHRAARADRGRPRRARPAARRRSR